jgi:hypothetical protein
MTTTPADPSAPADLRLGRDVVRRMRLPGPPIGRPLPSRIGSLASSLTRFAAATSRPVDVRRALIGPGPHGLAGSTAPPRWWTPVAPEADAPAAASEPAAGEVRRTPAAATPAWLTPARPVAIRRLPERSLPRAAREVPNETTWTPGGIVGGLRGEVARVRRLEEVVAVGPMLTQTDRAKLNAGLAARSTQQAAAQQATSQPTVARRATTRTPRQSATASSAPSASEPSTAPSVPSGSVAPAGSAAPVGGASATVSAAGSAGSVAQPPPGASSTGPAPVGGASATVSAADSAGSVAQPPPGASSAGPAPVGGASATVPAADSAGSVAQPPPGASPAGPAPSPVGTPIRRVARPSWQLRAQQSRFDGLVRRTPRGHGGAPTSVGVGSPAATPVSVGLSSVVSRLATPDRLRPPTTSPGPSSSLESSVRGPEVVAAAGPGLIAGGMDAPATVRRHAWSAGSLVMRQAAGARAEAGVLAASRPAESTAPPAAPSARSTAAAPGAAPAQASTAAPGTATSTTSAPAARSAEPVVRRLPSAVGSAPVTAAESSAPSGGAQATVSSPDTVAGSPPAGPSGAQATESGPGTVAGSPPAGATTPATAEVRRLPRLWRRATDIRPATDVRSSIPAPVVRLAPDPASAPSAQATAATTVRRLPAASAPVTGTPAPSASPAAAAGTPDAPATSSPAATTSPAASSPTPTPTPTPTPAAEPATATTAAGTPTAPATTVRRSAIPVSRVGAHVASPGIAGADLGMPELMTIRRATSHGTDANRTLATGFGAPQTIRPAGSPVAAPVAAVGGETRLWRRTVTPSGAVRGFGAPAASAASPAAMAGAAAAGPAARAAAPAGGFAAGFATGRAAAAAGAPGVVGGNHSARAASPVRRTWQPWTDAPAAAGTAPGAAPVTSFPAGPPGAASAPTGRRPAPDVRRMTVAPPRISVAPSQPPAPPVPAVGRPDSSAQPSSSPSAAAAQRRSSNTASGTGGSLVESTAHLFATPDAPLVRRAVQPGGPSMSSLSPSPASSNPPIRRLYGQSSDSGTMSDETLSAAATDSLVDKVVERIERRVIEELERRGRSYGRGGF